MAAIPMPLMRLTYDGKDITRQIEKYLVDLSFLDRTEVESDEIDIVLDDGLSRWSNTWYPEKGATLSLDIGYQDRLVPAGTFEIDEVRQRWDMSGKRIHIRALSAIVSQTLRTQKEVAWENITLKKLAQSIAANAHLTVSGTIDNITLDRVTQYKETDLAFLRKISAEYGYVFNVKSSKLVFTKIGTLLTRSSVKEIGPDMIASLDITDATGRTFRIAKQQYYDPAKGRKLEFDAKQPADSDVFASDVFSTESFTENVQAAEIKAKARIQKIIDDQVRGSISLYTGTPLLVAGNNVTLVKIGKNSGVYNIESSSHTISKSGYSTSIEVFKISDISADKH